MLTTIIIVTTFVIVVMFLLYNLMKYIAVDIDDSDNDETKKVLSDKVAEHVEMLKKSGNWKEAFMVAKENLSQNQRLESSHMIFAKLLFDAKKYVDAIGHFSLILKNNPANYEAALYTAHAYLKTKQINKAINLYKYIIEKDPSNIEAKKSLAEVYMLKKDKNLALELYKSILETTTDDNEKKNIKLQITSIYCDFRDWDKMLLEASLLIETYPEDRTILSYLKKGYLISNRLEEVVDILKRLAELEPANGKHIEELAEVYLKLNRYKEVIEVAVKAMNAREINKGILYNCVAKAYIGLQDYDKALVYLKSIIAKFPRDVELKKTLGSLYCQLRKYEMAIDIYKDYLEIAYPSEIQDVRVTLSNVYLDYANYLFTQGKMDSVFQMYNKALEYNPSNTDIYVILGDLNFSIRNYQEAIKYYKMAIEIAPENSDYYFKLGNLYYEIDNIIEAKKYYTQSLHIKPDLALAHAGVGLVEVRLKNTEAAIDAFSKALDIDPLNIDIRYNLALAYEVAMDTKSAIAQYKKVLDLAPNHVEAKNNLEILTNIY